MLCSTCYYYNRSRMIDAGIRYFKGIFQNIFRIVKQYCEYETTLESECVDVCKTALFAVKFAELTCL